MTYDEDEDDDFDYEEFVEREFGNPIRSKGVPLGWQIVAISLVAFFAFAFLMTTGLWTPF